MHARAANIIGAILGIRILHKICPQKLLINAVCLHCMACTCIQLIVSVAVMYNVGCNLLPLRFRPYSFSQPGDLPGDSHAQVDPALDDQVDNGYESEQEVWAL